jgi:hypothetical protein
VSGNRLARPQTLAPVIDISVDLVRRLLADRFPRWAALSGSDVPLRYVIDGAVTGILDPGATLTVRLRADAVNVVRLDADSHATRSGSSSACSTCR